MITIEEHNCYSGNTKQFYLYSGALEGRCKDEVAITSSGMVRTIKIRAKIPTCWYLLR